jgi:dipeptidyl aminopeptidase/acylaminoacyl peptidase
MTPEIVRRQVVVEEHDLAPDGRWAVIVRRAVAGERYVSHLWLVPLDGGRSRPLTRGAVRDSRPRVSPDGRRIAFRRSDVGDARPAQRLMVIELDGDPAGGAAGGAVGEPWTLTPGPAHVGELAWAPDGRRLAFTAEAPEPRFLVGREVAGRAPLGRRIRRIDWRHDESGHVDRWDHLFVVPAREGAGARRLTRGDFGVAGIAWRPDGRAIAFAADRGPEPDLRPRTTIWAVTARGGEPVELIALGGSASAPAYSPDGRWLAAIGVAEPNALDDVSPGLVVAPSDGSAPAVPLAPELDRPVGNWVDTDLNGWMAAGRHGPVWTAKDEIVAIVSDRGRSVPWRFPVDPATGRAAGAPEPLVRADATCVTLAVAGPIRDRERGGRGRLARRPIVSVVGTLGGRANELMTVEGAGPSARLRARTTLGSAWQRRVRQPEMRCLQAPGPGGPIETWLASPPGAGDAALPTVVDVHGGPLGAWAPAPSLEVALLVSRGYRVVLPNIRGSATYGRDWIRPQLGDWGGVDAADVHAALDEVVRLGLADSARSGVLGLSYGGFMVHWLIGTSDRFRAAVSENGVANQVNAWANSDTGVEYNRVALLGDPLTREGMERLWRQSPLAHVADVRTPLLMFQAEADERCPKADNEQFFTALRVLRREVEYVLYPEEYHVYATTGRPDRRVDRMTRMLDWFDRFLQA